MNILIIRTSALGDIVHSLPVLTALRRHLPGARIGWVVEETFAPLLAGHPWIDELLPVRLRVWRRSPGSRRTLRETSSFLGALRSFRADVGLNLMGNHKGGILCALSGARRRVGLERPARREPSSVLWDTQTAAPRGRHAVERALSSIGPLGLPPEPADFGGEHLYPERDSATRSGEDAPFCLLHPGAAWGNKLYPPERWAAVARQLAEATGLAIRVALSPSPAEQKLAARIVELAEGSAQTIDAMDLPTLVRLSRRARLVLGGDTGPTHLAHALGTSVLCLMGPTDPERHGPYGHPERALASALPCSFCYRRFESTKACLLALRPADVVERAEAILLDSATAN
jgi:lipopolysaccharide heptosyltransferase I